MDSKNILLISTLFAIIASATAKKEVSLFTAVFSDQQHFWEKWETPNQTITPPPSSIKIGILPIITNNYVEEKVCDSCHRLSPNGMQFFLENYFLHKISSRRPNQVELIAPQMDLVVGQNLPLMNMVDSLQFPLEKWFDNFKQEIIYRPKDYYTSIETKNVLNQIGGKLGYTHLLIPTRFKMIVKPTHSENFFGGLQYGFILIFWNVTLAHPEWAVSYSEKSDHVNLDLSLEKTLDKNLLSWLDKIPGKIKSLRSQEPK